MNNLIAIFIGGGLGSVARYGISRWVYAFFSSAFPYGTLAANIVACFILGFFMGLSGEKLLISPTVKIFLTVGFCGGFSTFSSFSYETLELIRLNQYLPAVLNVALNIIICFASTFGGILISKYF